MNNYIQTIGGNKTSEPRAEHDYYATEPKATELLLNLEKFNHNIWECACGELHMAEVLKSHGYNVRCSDLIQRLPEVEPLDFLNATEPWDGDIVTNPPYRYATQFIEKAHELVHKGSKIAMFLKLQFLEGKARQLLFEKYPPKTIYISSSRLKCGKNGDFEELASSAICYCWYIWVKGYMGDTNLKWFN